MNPSRILIDEKIQMSLQDRASCLSSWFLSYLDPLFALGTQKDLTVEDLGCPSSKDRSRELYDAFSVYWSIEMQKSGKKPSLWGALWSTIGYARGIYSIFLYFLFALISFIPILILTALVKHFEGDKNLSVLQLWLYASGMFVLPIVASLFNSRSNIIVIQIAVRFRNTLINAIFRKALMLSPDSRQQQSTGKIINMFANDTNQVTSFLYLLNNLLLAPIQIAITVYLIYLQVGVSTFVGLGYMLIISPMAGIIFGKINNIRKLKIIQTDARVKMMNEILNGIRVIKYYAWEIPFKEKIDAIRLTEVLHSIHYIFI